MELDWVLKMGNETGKNMNQQKTAALIVSEVEEFSKYKLKMKEDLERVIDLCINSNNGRVLDEIAFTAKYLQGLFGIIQRGESSIDDEVLGRYMKEYSENIEKVKGNLSVILESASSFIRNIFQQKYFSMTQESVSNLNKLCYDLGWYKMYQNDQKIKE